VRRSKAPDLVVGLDVGTTKVCAIITEHAPRGSLNVIGVGSAPSRGLRRGIVVNIDSTVEAIRAAVGEAEQMAGVEISGAFAGIAGGHIRGVNSRGVVGITGKHHEVSDADVERVIEAARAINLPQDREIIHVLPQSFVVDDGDGVREPIGISGVRLEVEVHIVTGTVTSVQNVVRSVNRAGLAVQDIVLEPLASAEAVLFDDEKELGVVVIDIGGGTTDVALMRNGAVWHTVVLPLGGDHITNDIAIGLRTPTADAEGIKKRYGCALTALVPAEETVDVPSVGGRKPRQLSRQLLSAACRGDLHLGGARARPSRVPGRGDGGRRRHGRHIDHGRSPRACRGHLRSTRAPRCADRHRRAGGRDREPDLRDRRRAGALRCAHGRAG